MRLIVVVVVESRMCGRLFVLCEFESRCVRRSAAGLELGPLTFGGTRSAGLQPAINLPAGFPPARAVFHGMSCRAACISLIFRRVDSTQNGVHTLSAKPSQSHATIERTNESVSLVGLGETTCRPHRPGPALTRRLPLHQTSGRRHCTIAEHCRARGGVIAQAAAEAYSYRFPAATS